MTWNTGILEIDLSKVTDDLRKYAGQWVAVSVGNKVVGSGTSFREVTEQISGRTDVALFPIPELDVALAP